MKHSLAATVFVVGIGGTFAYVNVLRPELVDRTVLLATHTIQPNQVITRQDLIAQRVPTDVLPTGYLTPSDSVIGDMAAQVIPTHQVLSSSAVEKSPLALTRQTIDVPIVSTWIAGVPDSLRRGNLTDIYLYKQTPSSEVRAKKSLSAGAMQHITTREQPLLTDIPVEFVRNGQNQEVTSNSRDTNSYGLASRANGTAVPEELELAMTQQDFSKLLHRLEEGYQLIFAYSSSERE